MHIWMGQMYISIRLRPSEVRGDGISVSLNGSTFSNSTNQMLVVRFNKIGKTSEGFAQSGHLIPS